MAKRPARGKPVVLNLELREGSAQMALIGVLARLETSQQPEISRLLETIDGVSTFSVDEAERIGVLIEKPTLDAAHAVLTDQVRAMPGVLGVWPVFCHADEEPVTALT